jgi:hypothetical protein
MRPSPSFELTLRHFGVWFAGAGALTACAAAALVAWFVQSRDVSLMAGLAGGLAVAGLVFAARAVCDVRPTRLRWDGQRWFAATTAVSGEPPTAVDLNVAIDLGRWMLLRLRRERAPRGAASTWLPAQRRGHEVHWHALRCAVYSPRPTSGDPSAAEP